ncbi:MAG: hypothetical protein ACYTBJ_16010 [Planctomycetota bacterium]|jgi:hypothetical protein
MKVYLVYNTRCGNRDLEIGFSTETFARDFVEKAGRSDFEYRKTKPDQYEITSDYCEEWSTDGGDLWYTYGEDAQRTRTGGWIGQWGSFSIEEVEIYETLNADGIPCETDEAVT